MDWRRIGDKLLSEPMLTRFTDADMRHLGGGDELISGIADIKLKSYWLLISGIHQILYEDAYSWHGKVCSAIYGKHFL